MSVAFRVPSSPKRDIVTIDTFLGCDFTNSPAAVSETRSPNCVNMIRDVPGKVRKCMGYHTIGTYDGPINGYHYMHGEESGIVHAGDKIYKGDQVLYSGVKNARSKSWQFKDKLYIADGLKLLVYDGQTVSTVEDVGYIPTLTISKEPSGGGTDYEALNLLQPGFRELFIGDETSTAYHMTFGGLDEKTVEVQIMDKDGNWVDKTEGTDFTVDRTSGIINFTTAPGKSPITGEDNVKVTAYRTVEGYADRINKCTTGIQYGVSGALDRLFLSGNPDYINQDWYSGQHDPSYFPDIGYSALGSARSAIVGYSIINSYLAVHKDDMETDQTIILREGVLVEKEPAFKIVNTLQGAGAIAPDSFGYLVNEPLFLTRLGIYAVTAQDVTGEKYAQNRSFYLNGKLLKESNLEKAFSCVYKDMFWLCLNNVAYILDGLQPVQTDKSMPYATRQYVGFYRTNIPANVMWELNGDLYFGTSDGKICKFYNDYDNPLSYSDDGSAIESVWETPDLDGRLFYKNKTFRYMAVRLQSAVATSIKIWAMKRGIWSLIKEDDQKARYFTFSKMIFSKFTFSTDKTQKIISTKLRIKKVDKARFRLINDALNEPFSLFNIALEVVENGNYKG